MARAQGGARLVLVTSEHGHRYFAPNHGLLPNTLPPPREGWDAFGAYGLSKLSNVLHAAEAGGRLILVIDAVSSPQALHRFRRLCHRHRQGYYVSAWYDTVLRLIDRQEVVVFLWQRSHTRGRPSTSWQIAWPMGARRALGWTTRQRSRCRGFRSPTGR